MRIPAAIITFAFLTVLSALGAGALFSGLDALLAWISLTVGLSGAILAWRQMPKESLPPIKMWDWIMLAVSALVSMRAFLWLVFPREDELCVLSPNNLGDLSLHLNFIGYMASGVHFWPEHSILSGVPMTYPPGGDLFNSVLLCGGVGIYRGLIWVGLIGAFLTAWTVWRWGGAFALAALLFNGGLAGFGFLKTFQIPELQNELVWKNIFLTMIVTQRGLLFALPAGFLLLKEWRDVYFRAAKPALPWWLQGVLYAAMPLFNVHAFLFLSVVLLGIFCAQATSRKRLAIFVAAAFLPATLFMLLVTGSFAAGGGLKWDPGWIVDKLGWMSWIWNFGLSLPLALGLVGWLAAKGDNEEKCFVFIAALVFTLCCFIAFAPWAWDNMKLMVWSWLVIAPYLWKRIIAPLHPAAQITLCVVLFFSGAVSLADGLDRRHGYVIAHRSELNAWQGAVANLPPQARFACVPDFNVPIMLLGRKVACGYEGHLWSHGLPYHEKWDILQSALSGKLDWGTAADALQTDWLALRNKDDKAVRPPVPPVWQSEWGQLYDLRSLPRPNSTSR